MPIDPNLSLKIGVPGAASQVQYNPLGMMKDVMDIQGKAQGLEQGRRELAAKARAGQIFATASDPQDAYQKLQKDPLTAAYAQDLASGALEMRNKLLSGEQTQTQTQGLQQGQYKDAFGATMQAGLAALKTNDPAGNFDKFTKSYLQTQPAAIRKQIEPALKNFASGIFASGDTPEQSSQKLMGAFLGAGGNVSQLQPYLPTYNQTRTFGAQSQYGTQQGPLAGSESGQFQPTTPMTMAGVAPGTSAAEGGGVIPVPAIPAQPVGGAGGAVPTATASTPSPAQNLTGSPITVGGGASNGLMGSVEPTTPSASTNGPLGQSAGNSDAFANTRAVGQQAGTAASMRKDFQSAQAINEYNATQATVMQMDQLDKTLDNIGQAGGFTQPGAFGNLRTELAKIVNTAQNIAGVKESFDPNLLGQIDKAKKLTLQSGAQLAQSLTRGPEAQKTIESIGSAVPSLENTPLGNKMVIGSIQAQLQREVDRRAFKSQYLQQNGSLEGSDEAFNQQHPPEAYSKQALDKLGLINTGDPKTSGFKSIDDVKNALQKKLITPEQAKAIARSDPRLLNELNSRAK